MPRRGFSGLPGETSSQTSSRPSRRSATSATWRWPACAGLKLPPSRPIRARRLSPQDAAAGVLSAGSPEADLDGHRLRRPGPRSARHRSCPAWAGTEGAKPPSETMSPAFSAFARLRQVARPGRSPRSADGRAGRCPAPGRSPSSLSVKVTVIERQSRGEFRRRRDRRSAPPPRRAGPRHWPTTRIGPSTLPAMPPRGSSMKGITWSRWRRISTWSRPAVLIPASLHPHQQVRLDADAGDLRRQRDRRRRSSRAMVLVEDHAPDRAGHAVALLHRLARGEPTL